MVNFSSDEALKIPISDIKKQLLLEKQEELNQTIKLIWADNQMTSDEINILRSKVIFLFKALQEHAKRHYPKKYEKMKGLYKCLNYSQLEECIELMEEIIYDVVETNKEKFY